MSKTKKQIKRRQRYGMVKIAGNEKMSWLSYQNKHGWSLGLALGKKTMWLKNVRFATLAEAKRALKAAFVSVPVKGE